MISTTRAVGADTAPRILAPFAHCCTFKIAAPTRSECKNVGLGAGVIDPVLHRGEFHGSGVPAAATIPAVFVGRTEIPQCAVVIPFGRCRPRPQPARLVTYLRDAAENSIPVEAGDKVCQGGISHATDRS
ncbi:MULTISPECIES: hypothetical protein [Nocardia]|uniref:hypothetical protein n=1 Tax=Nocardia abscessus TaxID=120957 RepID=UPI001893D992|nr:hypothetical protein [Nocardia abscessus]MBF6475530.1 hypothetical protein [Nocardia abscessus]